MGRDQSCGYLVFCLCSSVFVDLSFFLTPLDLKFFFVLSFKLPKDSDVSEFHVYLESHSIEEGSATKGEKLETIASRESFPVGEL